jgi:hypothetical protein
MSTRRHRNSDKANEWAKKRAEAIALAKQRRAERKRGQVSEEHTFKPQQISKPPSRDSGNGGTNSHGHPGVYDRNGRDIYYDRQDKSYPIPQNIQAQSNNYISNFAPPQQQQFNGQYQQQQYDQFGVGEQQHVMQQQDIYQKPKMSELDQLHMAGDSKFGKPRGYVAPVQQQQRQQGNFYQQQNNYGGPNNVEDELDRFYAGQFENMKTQQQNATKHRPRPSLQTNNIQNTSSRYGQVMSPNSDSLVHEARRVYNNPSIGRGGDNDFLKNGRRNQSQNHQGYNNEYEEENVPPMSKSQKHQQEADNNFQSWLRSDDDNKSKSISKSGWNSDFADAGSLGRYDSEEPVAVRKKPARRKQKPAAKKKPQWNNDWAGVENNEHASNDNYGTTANSNLNNNGIQRQRQQPMHQQQQRQPPQRGAYRTMISASDIIGNDANDMQGSMTPPQVSSRLRLLKKKVKRKESSNSDYDDYIDSNSNNMYNNNTGNNSNYYNQQQGMSRSQPARRTQHQPVQQQGWNANTRGGGRTVDYSVDNKDPFGQSKANTNKSLSYHDIDNQPLGGGGGGGGYNSRFDNVDDGGFIQEQQPPPRRQQQPQRRRQQMQHQQRRNPPKNNEYNNSNGQFSNNDDLYARNNHQHYEDNYHQQQQQAPPREFPRQQQMNDEQPSEFAAPVQLFACPHCSRKFNEKAHAKHVPNCKKVFINKRKPMDMTARRLEEAAAQSGNAREAIKNAKRAVKAGSKKSRRPGAGRGRPIKAGKKGGKWKAQSNALREAMKQSRIVTKYQKEGRLDELPPMKSTGPDPSFVPCPHCGRTFNEKAAERHIPRCKDIKAKPSFLKRGVGKSSASTRRGTKRY